MNLLPGDVGFAHTKGWMGRFIRWGEWLRFRKGSWVNHAFTVDSIDEDGTAWIVQATLRGVIRSKLEDVAPGGTYFTVAPPGGVDRVKIVEFAAKRVGDPYGVGTIAAIAFDLLSWNWIPSLRGARRPSWVCSALVAETLRFGGWDHQPEWPDVYEVTPAQLVLALDLKVK